MTKSIQSVALALIFLVVPVANSQSRDDSSDDRTRYNPNELSQERTAIEGLLLSLVGLVKEVATDATASGVTSRLHEMTSQLSALSNPTGYSPNRPEPLATQLSSGQVTVPLRADELQQLEVVLKDVVDQLVAVRHELHIEGKTELAKRTETLEEQLLDGIGIVRSLRAKEEASNYSELAGRSNGTDSRSGRANRSTRDGYLEPGTYSGDSGESRDDRSRDADWKSSDSDSDDEWWGGSDGNESDTRWSRDRRHRRSDWTRSSGALATYVGEFRSGWPYKETGVYRTMPAIRYNRVDGLVLGLRKLPLAWDSWERTTVYGHGGYAIASRRWQYEIGAESRLGRRDAQSIDVKLGGSYRRATTTDDLWKSSWLENSTGALLFNYDFFDYFETEGFTGYATFRVSPFAQITGAYRTEEYRSLQRETDWSLFGGSNFTFNPAVQEDRMNSILIVAEGGSVRNYDWLPRGAAFRIEGEIGQGLGGDFDFSRVVADGRVYLPAGNHSTLAFRVRGGLSDGDLPYQKAFKIGGVGSVRAYAQNAYVGTRMLVGNVEYMFAQDILFDDLTLSVFADGGWLNTPSTNAFRLKDVFPTAGVGAGLIDQSIRLELAWPLDKDVAGTSQPSLWIRLARAF